MYVSWRGIRNSSCPFLMGWPSSISHAAQAQLNLIHCRLSAGCAYSRSVYTFQRPGHHAFYRTFLHARSPRLSLSGKGEPESQFHAPCRDKTLLVNSRGIWMSYLYPHNFNSFTLGGTQQLGESLLHQVRGPIALRRLSTPPFCFLVPSNNCFWSQTPSGETLKV